VIKKRYTDIVTVVACLLLFAQCVRGGLHHDIKALEKKVAEATEKSNGTKEALNNNIAALERKVAEATEQSNETKEALNNNIAALERKVAEATEQSNETKEALDDNIDAFGALKKQLVLVRTVLSTSLVDYKGTVEQLSINLERVNEIISDQMQRVREGTTGYASKKEEKDKFDQLNWETMLIKNKSIGSTTSLIKDLDTDTTRSVPPEISVSNPRGPIATHPVSRTTLSTEDTSGSAAP
jgi:cell division septum initiation protein DivIVA